MRFVVIGGFDCNGGSWRHCSCFDSDETQLKPAYVGFGGWCAAFFGQL